MNVPGLSVEELNTIGKVLCHFPEIEEAILFGSRAMGNHKPGSDVDIALKGKDLNAVARQVGGILNDESPLPYKFDVLSIDETLSENLKDHVAKWGMPIYKRDQKSQERFLEK